MIVLTCFNHISDALEGWTKFPWIQAQKLLGCIGVDAIVHICGYGNIYIYIGETRERCSKMQVARLFWIFWVSYFPRMLTTVDFSIMLEHALWPIF